MRHALLALLSTTALAVSATAQTASFTRFGSGSGTPHDPILDVTGTPQIGSSFSISVDYNNPPFICTLQLTFWQAVLVYGFSNTSWAGLPLPYSFPQGFDLLVGADLGTFVSTTSNGCPPHGGNAPVYTITIPNDPGLIGFQWYNQIIMQQIGSSTAIATDGGLATVGT